MITKIYSYHCHLPTADCLDNVSNQFYHAHKYQNKLIELERKLFQDKKELELVCDPSLQELYDRVSALESALLAAIEAHTQSKVTAQDKLGSEELFTVVKTSRTQLREAQKALADARKKTRATEQYKSGVSALTSAHFEARKAVYNSTPELFWGTKNHCVQRVEAAVSRRIKLGQPPNFQPWSRDGVLYAQVIGGMDSAAVYDCKSGVVQIERINHKMAWVRMRIGSNGRNPIWCTVKAVIDRPFPQGSRVMAVQLVRREHMWRRKKVDGQFHPYDDYEIQFVLRIPSEPYVKGDRSGAIAIDLGWRLRPDGLRVGLWADTFGNRGEFLLPLSELAQLERARGIQSTRDRLFNGCQSDVIEWHRELPDELPEWLEKTGVKFCKQWKSVRALFRLLSALEANPEFAPATLATLREWREKEAHLQQYQRGVVWHQEARRLDFYRNIAAQLERKYERVIFEDMSVAALRTDPMPEDDIDANEMTANIRAFRNLSAIGLLRQCVIQKFGKARSILGKTAFTTIECSQCGVINTIDRAKINITCRQCCVVIDQDYNAALNLLNFDRPCDEETTGPARSPNGDGGSDVMAEPSEYVGRFAKRKATRSKMAEQSVGGEMDVK